MYKIKAIYIETISIHYVYINETDNVFMNIFLTGAFRRIDCDEYFVCETYI